MEDRPTIAYIDIGALKFNFNNLKNKVSKDTAVMAVVKADAYGHGDLPVAKALEEEGADAFGVVMPEEGVRLRTGGIKKPVIVLGGLFPGQIKTVFDYSLTPVVFDIKTASLLNELAGRRSVIKDVHVKLDTGMGRLGLMPGDTGAFFEEFKRLKNLRLEGVMSHFSSADGERGVDAEFSKRQLKAFIAGVCEVESFGISPAMLHMANSAAICGLDGSHFNLVRPGIMLYGAHPSRGFREKIDLKPVMEIRTRIVHLKTLQKGAPVSYGRRFKTKRRSVIAVLPMGYADGLKRGLSGKGAVLVNGKRAPMTGAVCMDFVMCDVTGAGDVRVGQEAVIIGRQGRERITVEEVAENAGTISYEIFCNVSGRVPRVYVGYGHKRGD